MNIYTRQFVAICPNNSEPILYTLRIETDDQMIHVEHIVAATQIVSKGFHENIANTLHRQFGGRHVLKAHHHGVDIETVRGGL
jgi:hypothetical protein